MCCGVHPAYARTQNEWRTRLNCNYGKGWWSRGRLQTVERMRRTYRYLYIKNQMDIRKLMLEEIRDEARTPEEKTQTTGRLERLAALQKINQSRLEAV